jgi:hypothetical protein
MVNAVNITNTLNKVIVTSPVTTVTPENIDHTVVVDGTTHVLSVSSPNVTLRVVQNPVAVSVQSATIGVVTGGVQGPQGPPGLDATSDEIIVLNKAERQDTVEDTPTAGDITVYYGVATPQTLDSSALWLITRQIYTADGEAFDSAKRFASVAEDQIWNDRLGLTYT